MSAVPVAPQNDEDFYTDLPVGEILRRARLQMGVTIPQAEATLHIRASHLEALERSDFDALPGRVYVIGFIRTYAEFLSLDGARVIYLLKRQSSGLGTPQSLNVNVLPADTRLPSVPLTAAAVAGFLLLMVLWVGYQNSKIGAVREEIRVPEVSSSLNTIDKIVANIEAEETPAIKKDQAAPTAVIEAAVDTVVPEPIAPPVASPPPTIELQITADSWLELRRPDGRVVEARVFRTGEVVKISISTPGYYLRQFAGGRRDS